MIKTRTYKNIYKTHGSTKYTYVQIKPTYTNNGDREQKHTYRNTLTNMHTQKESTNSENSHIYIIQY